MKQKEAIQVALVGAGVANVFAGLEFLKHQFTNFRIYEKGPLHHNPPSISGFLGAGLNSDGKLIYNAEGIGGRIRDEHLIDYVRQCFQDLEVKAEIVGKGKEDKKLTQCLNQYPGLRFVPTWGQHIGTDGCQELAQNIYTKLKDYIQFNTLVEHFERWPIGDQIVVYFTNYSHPQIFKQVIIAPGRAGTHWVQKILADKVTIQNNIVDLGVRVELPADSVSFIFDHYLDPKFYYKTPTYQDNTRTFCVCHHGQVIITQDNQFKQINGHSYKNKKMKNSNFALLVSLQLLEPFNNANDYVKQIANLSQLLNGNYVTVQAWSHLRDGKTSAGKPLPIIPSCQEAVPGDISLLFPYRYLLDIQETILALSHYIDFSSALLYAVEAKSCNMRFRLSPDMELVEFPNLYLCGDASGISRGIVQAAATGILAARHILQKSS